MIWSPSCCSSGPASAPRAIVIAAVWGWAVSWSTRKNSPRWAPTSSAGPAPRLARTGRVAQRADGGGRVGRAEDGRAGDQRGGAVLGERGGGGGPPPPRPPAGPPPGR